MTNETAALAEQPPRKRGPPKVTAYAYELTALKARTCFTRTGHLFQSRAPALLARAVFYGRQTAHGVRASFSTWANETHAADPDVIEACLAHKPGGGQFDYNHATYVARRRKVLQAWGDKCEAWGMRVP